MSYKPTAICQHSLSLSLSLVVHIYLSHSQPQQRSESADTGLRIFHFYFLLKHMIMKLNARALVFTLQSRCQVPICAKIDRFCFRELISFLFSRGTNIQTSRLVGIIAVTESTEQFILPHRWVEVKANLVHKLCLNGAVKTRRKMLKNFADSSTWSK